MEKKEIGLIGILGVIISILVVFLYLWETKVGISEGYILIGEKEPNSLFAIPEILKSCVVKEGKIGKDKKFIEIKAEYSFINESVLKVYCGNREIALNTNYYYVLIIPTD